MQYKFIMKWSALIFCLEFVWNCMPKACKKFWTKNWYLTISRKVPIEEYIPLFDTCIGSLISSFTGQAFSKDALYCPVWPQVIPILTWSLNRDQIGTTVLGKSSAMVSGWILALDGMGKRDLTEEKSQHFNSVPSLTRKWSIGAPSALNQEKWDCKFCCSKSKIIRIKK